MLIPPGEPSSRLRTFEVLHNGETEFVRATQVLKIHGWLIFRVNSVNVGRFPAKTTKYRVIALPVETQDEP